MHKIALKEKKSFFLDINKVCELLNIYRSLFKIIDTNMSTHW